MVKESSKESLTNEKLGKRFKNQFDLVNYAIKLAENMIKTGRETRFKTDVQNRALQIIGEISTNKDQFDEIPVQVVEENRYEDRGPNGKQVHHHHDDDDEMSKPVEKKKGRKILVD